MLVLGVSGGVDSSVCAVLLKERGVPFRGVFMDNWDNHDPVCSSNKDRMDALKVCAKLGVPFSSENFAQEYKDRVFREFLEGYSTGQTPNPDILCNREIKFDVFLRSALAAGASGIVTGHYARTNTINGKTVLLRGVDPTKDQSYFLHAVSSQELAFAQFPLGELMKTQVRQIAQDNDLGTKDKKDSTGICFIGERDFKEFLSEYLPAQPGKIVSEDGVVLGEHQGALYYTQGQTAPLGGLKGYPSGKWFVLRKDVSTNTLVVTQDRAHPKLMPLDIQINNMRFVAGSPPSTQFDAQVQIRHLGEAVPARVSVRSDGKIDCRLSRPHFAPACGQYAVLYEDDLCLGGGQIV